MAFGQTGINTGTGAEVTTDLVGTAVTQVVKLDGGVSGVSNPILATDADSGAGTDYALPFVLKLPASGGGVNAPGDAAFGQDVDVTRMVDGANVTQGATTDAAVTTDANGTLSGKLRGLVKIFADVWDGVNHWLVVHSAQLPSALVGARLDVNVGKVAGTVSTANASIIPLAGAASFTGTGEDVSSFASVTVSVATDQISAGSGLKLQWSSDNSNWDFTQAFSISSFLVTGGSAPGVVVTTPVQAQYFRVVLTNGATLQTLLRLQTVYHPVAMPPLPCNSGNGQGFRAAGMVPMVWDSTNDITGPVRSFGSQPDNGGASTAATTGVVALNASGNPDKLRTANGAAATIGTGLLGAGNLLWDLVGGVNWFKQACDGSGRAMVGGGAAVGSGSVGNPLPSGVHDGTNAQRLKGNTDGTLAVGGFDAVIAGTVTRPADTIAYAAGDAVANSTSAPTAISFSSATRLAAGSGFLVGATLVDQANQTTKLQATLYLFSASPTATNDNAALAVANTDLANLIGIVDFSAAPDITNAAAGASGNVVIPGQPKTAYPFNLGSGSTVYGLLQVNNGYTPTSAEVLRIILHISQN